MQFAQLSVNTIGFQFLASAGSLVSSLVIARLLGPEGKGEFTFLLLFSWLLFLVTNGGTGHALSHFGAASKYLPQTIWTASLTLWFLITPLAFVLNYVAQLTPLRALIPDTLLWISSLASFRLGFYLFAYALLGQKKITSFNVLGLIDAWLPVVGFSYFLIATPSIEKVVVVYILSGLLTVIVGIVLAFPGQYGPIKPSIIVDVFRYGLQIASSQIAQFLNYRLDSMLLALYSDFRELGLYSASWTIVEGICRLPSALSNVLYPYVSSEPSDGAKKTKLLCRITTFIMLISILLIASTGKLVLSILFGQSFTHGHTYLLLLLPSALGLSVFKLLYHDLAGRGRPELSMKVTMATLLVTVFLDVIFVPRWAAFGAALASSVAYSFAGFLSATYFSRVTGIPARDALIIRSEDLKLVARRISGMVSNFGFRR